MYFYVHVDSFLCWLSVHGMEQCVSTGMPPYTDEAFCLKDKVENCAGVDSPALVPPSSFVVKTCIMIQNFLLIESKYEYLNYYLWQWQDLHSEKCKALALIYLFCGMYESSAMSLVWQIVVFTVRLQDRLHSLCFIERGNMLYLITANRKFSATERYQSHRVVMFVYYT